MEYCQYETIKSQMKTSSCKILLLSHMCSIRTSKKRSKTLKYLYFFTTLYFFYFEYRILNCLTENEVFASGFLI